jgi:hypothetical protein
MPRPLSGANCDAANPGSRASGHRWLRGLAVASALVVASATALITVYWMLPEIAASRAFDYESSADEQVLVGVWRDAEAEIRRRNSGSHLMYPVAIDPDRRYVLVSAPQAGQGGPGMSSYGVLDSDRERFIGSFYVKPQRSWWSFDLTSQTEHLWSNQGSPGELFWKLTAKVKLPGWWPGRDRWGSDGSFERTAYVRFETRAARWSRARPGAGDVLDARASPRRDVARYFNRRYPLPGTDDELITEHDLDEKRFFSASFRRLVRRNRNDGTIRWELTARDFARDRDPAMTFQILLPLFRLKDPVDWCMLPETGTVGQTMATPAFWRLDVATGGVANVNPPVESTPENADVSDDGQTLVFLDRGVVRYAGPSGGGGRSTGKQTRDLVAWDAEGALRTVYQTASFDLYPIVLPRGRVLVFGMHGPLPTTLVVPIDGSEPRQVYP